MLKAKRVIGTAVPALATILRSAPVRGVEISGCNQIRQRLTWLSRVSGAKCHIRISCFARKSTSVGCVSVVTHTHTHNHHHHQQQQQQPLAHFLWLLTRSSGPDSKHQSQSLSRSSLSQSYLFTGDLSASGLPAPLFQDPHLPTSEWILIALLGNLPQ